MIKICKKIKENEFASKNKSTVYIPQCAKIFYMYSFDKQDFKINIS